MGIGNKGGEAHTHVPEGFDSRFDWSTRWSISALLSVHPGSDRNVLDAIIKRFVGEKDAFQLLSRIAAEE